MDSRDTVRSILDSLRRLVRELRVFSRGAEESSGLTAAQLFVLEKVAASEPVSVNALAELTLTHQSSVSVVVRKLAERGFLRQGRSPADGRRSELTMTAAGRQALGRSPGSFQERLVAAASEMSPADQRSLERLLGRLTRSIGIGDATPVLFFEREGEGEGRGGRPGARAQGRRPRRLPPGASVEDKEKET